jgi:hypothetical protein
MDESVMKLAFLRPTPRDPLRSENAARSVRTDLAGADGLMVAELDLAGLALQAVFQIGGGKNRAPASNRSSDAPKGDAS